MTIKEIMDEIDGKIIFKKENKKEKLYLLIIREIKDEIDVMIIFKKGKQKGVALIHDN